MGHTSRRHEQTNINTAMCVYDRWAILLRPYVQTYTNKDTRVTVHTSGTSDLIIYAPPAGSNGSLTVIISRTRGYLQIFNYANCMYNSNGSL